MKPVIDNELEGCPENCRYHDLRVNWDGIESWGGELASVVINVRCEHQDVCKLRKEGEHGEEYHAG